MKNLFNIMVMALIISLFSGCGAYRRHPVATTTAIGILTVAPVGICIGIGDCGGDNGNSWQNDAAHYGVAQFSVLAVIIAGTIIAISSPDANIQW